MGYLHSRGFCWIFFQVKKRETSKSFHFFQQLICPGHLKGTCRNFGQIILFYNIHTYIHTYMHTYIHTYIHTYVCLKWEHRCHFIYVFFFFLYGQLEVPRCRRFFGMVRPLDRPLTKSPEMKTSSFFMKFRFWVTGLDWVFSQVTKCLVMDVS
jgi:hypothetical protein